MKDDEKVFFIVCYRLCSSIPFLTVRDIVNAFNGIIHHKRCWYLLEKWSNIGFYDYGITLDLGWFNSTYFPQRYWDVLNEFNDDNFKG